MKNNNPNTWLYITTTSTNCLPPAWTALISKWQTPLLSNTISGKFDSYIIDNYHYCSRRTRPLFSASRHSRHVHLHPMRLLTSPTRLLMHSPSSRDCGSDPSCSCLLPWSLSSCMDVKDSNNSGRVVSCYFMLWKYWLGVTSVSESGIACNSKFLNSYQSQFNEIDREM